MEYLIIIIFWFVIVFLIHQYSKVKVFKSKKHILMTYLPILIAGILWDTVAIYRGHWIYQKGMLGINIGLMPLEDYLFIIIVIYAILVFYKLLDKKFQDYRK